MEPIVRRTTSTQFDVAGRTKRRLRRRCLNPTQSDPLGLCESIAWGGIGLRLISLLFNL
jgi:hypothetical protein